MADDALVIIADSERNADLYYASHFLAPDAFIWIRVAGRSYLLMSDLEVDRAKAQARVDEVLSYSALAKQMPARSGNESTMYDVIGAFLRARQVSAIVVPAACGIQYVEGLRAVGCAVRHAPDPFFPQRTVKSAEEIAAITQTQRATEAAFEAAIGVVRNTEIKDGLLYSGGKPLTAELIRKVIHLHLMERECVGQHTIIACGTQACDPHNEGSGPLKAHEAIVMDIFPQHSGTRYYADMSRTVVRGTASPKIQRMYEAVRQGQEIAFGMLKPGVDGRDIHQAILQSFERAGFPTGVQQGRMQGFFHGTGHGLGLEVHEPPRISARSDILAAGTVVTVEPGLYYLDAGGVRLEDLVVVTTTGCRNLTEAPKILEL